MNSMADRKLRNYTMKHIFTMRSGRMLHVTTLPSNESKTVELILSSDPNSVFCHLNTEFPDRHFFNPIFKMINNIIFTIV